jgi:hypothetical protein
MSKTRFNELELTDDGDDSVTFYFKTGTTGVSMADANGDLGNIDFEEDVYYWKSRPNDNGTQDISIPRTFTISQYTPSVETRRQMTINPAQIVTSASGEGQTYYYTSFVPAGNRLYFPQGMYRGTNGIVNKDHGLIADSDSDYGFNIKELSSVVFLVNGNEITSNTTVKIGDTVKLKLTANNSFKEPTTDGVDDTMNEKWCDRTTNMITFTVGSYTFAPTLSPTAGAGTAAQEWTGTFTVSSSYSSGALSFNVNFLDIYDNRADRITQTTNGYGITLDTTAPYIDTLSISNDNSQFFVTFNESVYNSSSGFLQASNFSVSISDGTDTYDTHTLDTISNSNKTYTLGLSLTESSNGSQVLTVTPVSIYDAAGNEASGSSSVTLYDTTAPIISSFTTTADNRSYKQNDQIEITANTNEPIQNGNTITVTLSDQCGEVTLTAPSAGTILEGTYTVGAGDSSAGLTVSSFVIGTVADTAVIGTVADTAGNTMTSTNLPHVSSIFGSKTIVIDGIAPTMDISTNDVQYNDISNLNPITFTFTATKATSDFISDDIFTTNGDITAFFTSSDTVYIVQFTPRDDGPCEIKVPADSFTDAVGNNNDVSDTFSWTFDGTAPNLSDVSILSSNTTNTLAKVGDVITLSMTANEPIDTPTVTFQCDTTTIDQSRILYTKTSGNTWTAVYTTSLSDSDGDDGSAAVTYSIAFSDTAGNAGTTVSTGSGSVTFDKTAPSVRISSTAISSGDTSNHDPLPLTFTVTEATTNLLASNITTTNCTLNTLETTDNITFTTDLDPANNDVLCTVQFPDGIFTDAAGNPNIESDAFTWTYDGSAPTMTISTSDVTLDGQTNANSISVTFTSGETTSNFEMADIDTTNGSISDFSGSGTTYTATFTSKTDGLCEIKVPAGSFTDTVGNDNAVSNIFSWTFDGTEPIMVITSSSVNDGGFSNESSILLLFTSDETITDFTIDDISVSNGTLSNFTGSGTTYTATFTPNVETECTVKVLANSFADVTGNKNTQNSTFTWTYDITPPSQPTIKFKETNLLLNYSYPSGSSVLYYKNNATGSTSKYYNNILSITFASDVYKWDYSLNGGTTYTTIIGNTDNSITLTNGTYNPGSIIIRNYDEATNVSSVTNKNQIVITYKLNGNTINNENMSNKSKVAQSIRIASK